MKKISAILASSLLFMSVSSFAVTPPQVVQPVTGYPRLNTVSYQVSMEQWVNTQAALVTVNVAANVGQSTLDDLQKMINKNLEKLGDDAKWTIVRFDRSQDQSGLEKINVVAQARINQNQLAAIRSKAKSMSKPGMKYTISQISYQPTIADVQAVKDQLRTKIYQQVQQEIQNLDKAYKQEFFVNQIIFMPQGPGPVVPQLNMMARYKSAATTPSAQPNLGVSKKVVLTAQVILASMVASD